MSTQKEVKLTAQQASILVAKAEDGLQYMGMVIDGIKKEVIRQLNEPVVEDVVTDKSEK